MKVSVIPASNGNPIEHDIHFLLIDSSGHIHGVYDSRVPDEVDRLTRDAAALSAQAHP
jgi:cytochrome oxidase Cu insertion factor (SCO1/SenC/PrrC family)